MRGRLYRYNLGHVQEKTDTAVLVDEVLKIGYIDYPYHFLILSRSQLHLPRFQISRCNSTAIQSYSVSTLTYNYPATLKRNFRILLILIEWCHTS